MPPDPPSMGMHASHAMCALHTICEHPIEHVEEHVNCLYIGPGIISSLVTPLHTIVMTYLFVYPDIV